MVAVGRCNLVKFDANPSFLISESRRVAFRQLGGEALEPRRISLPLPGQEVFKGLSCLPANARKAAL